MTVTTIAEGPRLELASARGARMAGVSWDALGSSLGMSLQGKLPSDSRQAEGINRLCRA